MFKKDKPEEVKKLAELMQKYQVIGILNMHAMPAKQLHNIRGDLKGRALIRVAKNNMIKRALDIADKPNIKQLKDKLAGPCALLLTNENAFRLARYLDKMKMPAAAKKGDIAKKDIIIPKGPTAHAPGPAISTLQKVGLKTSVVDGKINVMQDKVVCKAGEEITDDMVNVFSLLKIEPMEIGLDIVCVWENGTIYERDVLTIDEKEYLNKLTTAIQQAFNLSLNIGYPTKQNIELMLKKCFIEAKSLALEACILDKEIIGELLAKAVAEAKALEEVLPSLPKEEKPKEEDEEEKQTEEKKDEKKTEKEDKKENKKEVEKGSKKEEVKKESKEKQKKGKTKKDSKNKKE